MTNTAPRRSLRTSLPMVGATGTGSHKTCTYKCGDDCFRDVPNASSNETFEEVVARAVSRRGFLKAGMASVVVLGAGGTFGSLRDASAQPLPPVLEPPSDPLRAAGAKTLGFTPIEPTTADAVVVPDGYDSRVLIRWGDPLFPNTPQFRFDRQTAAKQAEQFGYNCDYVAFMPLPWSSRFTNSSRGLLWVNHEYTNPELMFTGYDPDNPSRAQVDIELAAHGAAIVEIRRPRGERWFSYRRRSSYNRRLTAQSPMLLTGPAAGDPLLQTGDDPTGTQVLGTLNNCAGGVTPWGTVLTAEENFNQYFGKLEDVSDARVSAWHARYGLAEGESGRKWERYYPRFDLGVEPHEPFRHGWIVEVDPYDPEYVPRKRTALGRFKHEGATTSLAADSRVTCYLGDDERFDYVYKFVTAGRFVEGDTAGNADLLDEGTLYVARFDVDPVGNRVGTWIPMIHGEGALTADNGFASQAEVLVNTRGAADLLGATKMDRPEDIERNSVNGGVYINLTNNSSRGGVDDGGTADPNDDRFFPQEDAANPRAPNRYGHVIELFEEGNDAAATRFTWGIFLLCGTPDDPTTYFAGFDKSQVSPISSPDNIAFDQQGNLLLATDGQPGSIGVNDAFHFVPISGPERGHVQQFLSVPVGAEACGPEFTPDDQTLFCAVQHPGDDGSLEQPVSTWPDGAEPRPSVVSVFKTAPGDPRIGA